MKRQHYLPALRAGLSSSPVPEYPISGQRPTYTWWYRRLRYGELSRQQISGCRLSCLCPIIAESHVSAQAPSILHICLLIFTSPVHFFPFYEKAADYSVIRTTWCLLSVCMRCQWQTLRANCEQQVREERCPTNLTSEKHGCFVVQKKWESHESLLCPAHWLVLLVPAINTVIYLSAASPLHSTEARRANTFNTSSGIG